MNKDIKYALDYHEITKHSEASLMSSRHYLDFDSKPLPFKIYLELPSTILPKIFPRPEANAIRCISSMIHPQASLDHNEVLTTNKPAFNIDDLAQILFFSAGITREIKSPYGNYYMRAASATGALYPIELYVICDFITPSLAPGVYHFSPADFALREIRKGNYKSYLADITNSQFIHSSPLIIIFTSFAWRNAWKYQARSYRHWFWDSGVIAANLLATTAAMERPTSILMGFVDDSINELLCLEHEKESAVAIASIGTGLTRDGSASVKQEYGPNKISKLPSPKIRPLSKRGEIHYSEIWTLNQASKLRTKQEIKEWIQNAHEHFQSRHLSFPREKTGSEEDDNLGITQELASNINNSRNLAETILWRGSSRKFARTTIHFSTLTTIAHSSTRGVPLDIFKDGNSLIDLYVLANAVEGIAPGGYFYDRNSSAEDNPFVPIKHVSTSRNISTYLCLGQSLFGDASAVFFLLTDLKSVLKSLGNRGYRVSQFEAGVVAGKIYLAAYALGIGASGSTFFDDAVTEFFSPHANNKNTMIAVGIGVPGYKAKPGNISLPRLSKERLLMQDFV
jgi:SagB-type dehydrogenase family enzyme